jgi:hypothetical protein
MGLVEKIIGIEDLVKNIAENLEPPPTEEWLRAILINIFTNPEVIDHLDDETKSRLKNQFQEHQLPCPEGL